MASGRGLALKALAVAAREVGVREEPPGSNCGERVEAYLRAVGLGAGYAWCAAFVVWCFAEAARELGCANPLPATGGCLNLWSLVARVAPTRAVRRSDLLARPDRLRPGSVFLLELGAGHGHVGFVRARRGLLLDTIEGNSNGSGSPEGIGVFALTRRRLDDRRLRGVLDFTDV